MKILFVDDKEEERYLGETLLKNSGYEIKTAINGKEALERLLHENFDLIISDILMPVMDGFQFLREVRGDGQLKEIPFVFYTATYGDLEDEELALRIGADKFIRKPTDPEEFIAVIKGVLEDARKGKIQPSKPAKMEDTETFKLYSERLVKKLEKKMLDLQTEIKKRKKMEKERNQIQVTLERGKREWETTFDAISDWVCLLDLENRIIRTNRAAEGFLGMPLEELIGQKCCQVTHGSETPIPECPFQKMLRTHSREVIEMHLPETDQWLKVAVDPVLDDKGDVVTAVHIVSDITKIKKIEEEGIRSKKLESLGILAGGIAHDFNNLFTVILGNVELAKMCGKPGSEIENKLIEARKAILEAKDLTERFLTFSEGGAPLKETGSPLGIIQDAINSVQISSNIKIEVSGPDDIWFVDFDEGHIKQVFKNLMINANDALPQRGTIRIRAENLSLGGGDASGLKEGKYVKLSVEDDGIGIPEKDKNKIFDPYFSTKEMGGQRGMGLGLSVCHSIIKKHGGHIEVESEEGVGTTFSFYLPVSLLETPG